MIPHAPPMAANNDELSCNVILFSKELFPFKRVQNTANLTSINSYRDMIANALTECLMSAQYNDGFKNSWPVQQKKDTANQWYPFFL